MLKGSSLSNTRWLVDELVELLDLVDQKALRSMGEGWTRECQRSSGGLWKKGFALHTGR
jgi:hypothetical protein